MTREFSGGKPPYNRARVLPRTWFERCLDSCCCGGSYHRCRRWAAKTPTVAAAATLGETLTTSVIANALSKKAWSCSDEKLGYYHHGREPLVVERTASSQEVVLCGHRDLDHPLQDLDLQPPARSVHDLLV